MMGSVSIDTSGLRSLSADMRAVDSRLLPHVERVLEKGALNIKNQLREEANRSQHFRFEQSIKYERKAFAGFGVGEIVYEVGPEKGSPGSIANIAYFGTSRGGGTVSDPSGALNAESERLVPQLQTALERFVLS